MRYNNLSVKQYDKVQSMASSALLVTVTVMLGENYVAMLIPIFSVCGPIFDLLAVDSTVEGCPSIYSTIYS